MIREPRKAMEGVRDRITRYLSHGTPESSRKLIAYRCAMILLIVTCALTATVCYQGMELHPVDNGLLTCLTFALGIDATLAKFIFYKKTDEPLSPIEPPSEEPK